MLGLEVKPPEKLVLLEVLAWPVVAVRGEGEQVAPWPEPPEPEPRLRLELGPELVLVFGLELGLEPQELLMVAT